MAEYQKFRRKKENLEFVHRACQCGKNVYSVQYFSINKEWIIREVLD